MTDAEWHTCGSPRPMLEVLRGGGQDRRLRLFACACARSVWDLLPGGRSRATVEVAERFADGQAAERELWAARNGPRDPRPGDVSSTVYRATVAAATATTSPAPWSAAYNAAAGALRARPAAAAAHAFPTPPP